MSLCYHYFHCLIYKNYTVIRNENQNNHTLRLELQDSQITLDLVVEGLGYLLVLGHLALK